MFPFWSNLFYPTLILTAICLYHAIKVRNYQWIYLFFILPGIGPVVYFVMEVVPDFTHGNLMERIARTISPNGRIREWEQKVRIADTVSNRMQLAAAYAQQQKYDQAISLTQACAQSFPKDMGILHELGKLYYQDGQYEASMAAFDKVNAAKVVRMAKVEDELMYAGALEATGQAGRAEEEYQRTIRVHHSLEAMYRYGMLLKKEGRKEEARKQFQQTSDEIGLHPRYVRRQIRKWVWLSKKELVNL